MRQRTKVKRKLNLKIFVAFIIFEIFFTAVSAPLIVFYGPFETLRKMVVGASIYSFRHQYIARTFLSQEQIDKILNNGMDISDKYSEDYAQQDISEINVATHDKGIECKKIEGRKFDGYLLIVHDPKRVKVGYTKKLGIQGEKTSEMARDFGAVAAINGGGFTDKSQNSKAIWTGTGALPEGIIMADKKVVYPKNYNPNMTINSYVAGITERGVLVIGRYSIKQLMKKGVSDALVFGPPLLINGHKQTRDAYGNIIDNQGPAPRTAIGQKRDGSILFLVIDGRQGLKAGATIGDVQNVLKKEGAYNAINMDGGASTTMYFKGKVLNNPSDKFGERPIPTIFYVK